MLFFWSVYYFLFRYKVMSHIAGYPFIYRICFYVDIFTLLLSIAFGIYYNKVRKCWHCSLNNNSAVFGIIQLQYLAIEVKFIIYNIFIFNMYLML